MLIPILLLLALLRGVLLNSFILPAHLIGKNITITGVIASLPITHEHVSKFSFVPSQGVLAHQKINLAWYGHSSPEFKSGQVWRMTVRLKPPHGYHNPGSFNYERWARMQGIIATGYIREHPVPELLQEQDPQYQILIWRDQLRSRVPNGPMQDVLQALTLGFSAGLTPEHRLLLQNTGTAHLMAISGLHIGLVASVVFVASGWLLWFWPGVFRWVPKQWFCAVCSVVAAGGYGALAGFSVSTVRALIMVCVMMFGFFMRRASLLWSLCLALAVILLWSPLMIGSASMWLSFGAVGLLIYTMQGRPRNNSWWWRWARAQWVCSLGLLPLSVWYFHNISVISFIANLIAIPVVSFIVVPLALIGLGLPWCFTPAGWVLQCLFALLGWLDWHIALWMSSVWQLFCTGIALILWFLPRGLRVRHLVPVALLPMLIPIENHLVAGHFRLNVLDVGQGLACLIRTQHHTMLFDTGPRFEEFDAGRNIILPYLAQQRINKLDSVVVSHGDNDHIGGLNAIASTLPVTYFYGSELKKMPPSAKRCDQLEQWDWDGVHFAFLNDASAHFRKDNDNSCVLRISGQGGSVLLTGDIERRAELLLLAQEQPVASTIIVVPHHGSKTSSSPAFIERVNPKVAIFSYGYLNRFHHPSQQVLARYQQHKVKQLNTVDSGAIEQVL